MKKGPLIIFICLLVTVVSLAVYFFASFNIHFIGVKSIHQDALKYQSRHCLAFYPPGDNQGQEVVKDLCSNVKEDTILDYAIVPYGDCKLITYGRNDTYFLDQDNKELHLTAADITEEGKGIIADYLRYEMKKSDPATGYSLAFLEKSYVDNLDVSKVTIAADGDDLNLMLPDFDMTIKIPLAYAQKVVGKSFGYAEETYHKPRYIDPKRPMVALTFDDGPYIPTSSEIIDTLSLYDGVATFFCLGSNLRFDKEVPFIQKAVALGNEYGSHTQSHADLTKLSDQGIYDEIMTPANDLKNGFGYEMQLYRPPYGSHNATVDAVAPYPAILWNIDTLDWSSRNAEAVKEVVYAQVDENDVLLFHDIYQSTADAIKDIVPHLIAQGYQLVTVSELMDALDIPSDVAYFSGK